MKRERFSRCPYFLFIPLSPTPETWLLGLLTDFTTSWGPRRVTDSWLIKQWGPSPGPVDFVENQQDSPSPSSPSSDPPAWDTFPLPLLLLLPGTRENNNRNLPRSSARWMNKPTCPRICEETGQKEEQKRGEGEREGESWGLEAMWTRSKGRFVPTRGEEGARLPRAIIIITKAERLR